MPYALAVLIACAIPFALTVGELLLSFAPHLALRTRESWLLTAINVFACVVLFIVVSKVLSVATVAALILVCTSYRSILQSSAPVKNLNADASTDNTVLSAISSALSVLSRFYAVIEKRCRERINLLAAGGDLDDRETIFNAFAPEEIVRKVEDYIRALREHDADAAERASQTLDKVLATTNEKDRLLALAQLAKSMVPNILRDAKRQQKSSVRRYALAPVATDRRAAPAPNSNDRETNQPAPRTAQARVEPSVPDLELNVQAIARPAEDLDATE